MNLIDLLVFAAPILSLLALVGAILLWLAMLLDMIKRTFANSNHKVLWLLAIIFMGPVGALIYYLSVRRPRSNVGGVVALLASFLVLILLLTSPVAALILGVKYKAWTLERGFETNIPVYPGAETLSAGTAGNDLNPIPNDYAVSYKIDPRVPLSTIREFYNEKLTQKGWVLNKVVADSPHFSRGNEGIKVFLKCANSPSTSTGTPKSGVCADLKLPGYYLEAHIYYFK